MRRALLALALCLGGLVASSAAAQAAQPIEGFWRLNSGNVIGGGAPVFEIVPSGSGFVGLTTATKCTAPGFVEWSDMTGSGGSYTANIAYFTQACAPAGRVPGTFTVTGNKLTIVASNASRDTFTLTRVSPAVIGKSAAVFAVKGTVKVRRKGSRTFAKLGTLGTIPIGSEIDATRGTISVSTAAGRSGGLQSAQLSGGRFVVTQRASAALTTLALSEPLTGCGRVARAAAKRKTRRLFGSGHGAFTTKGKYGTATIRGTKWTVQDSCTTTKVSDREGSVLARDLRTGRSVLLKAGQSFTARKTTQREI